AAVAGSSLGLMVTGPMVPAILQHYPSGGWRISWWVLSAMTLAIGAVAYLCLRNRPADLGLQAIGESTAEQDGPLNRSSSSRPSGPPGEETELATTSVRQTGARSSTMNSGSEKQSQSSVSTLSWGLVYRSKVLWQLAVIYFGFGFSYIIYSTFFVRYLTAEAGFSSSQAGALWFQIGVVSIISGFLWGGVSDRCGRKTALLWVLSLQSIAFFLSGITREAWSLYLAAGLFAITAWSVPALMAALCGDLFGGRLAPAALGLITMVFGIGQALGPLAAGIIADATHSFGPALMLGGLAALVLGVGGTLLPKHWDR
ncbi:MAG TPA: YbfB/YjiJ family MFS transporter, partial [Candidatus Paceibacterota bacterium]|nr:YbfB/YjiJ family MFS transporter [Candidatus Paceibacterota bacterium]